MPGSWEVGGGASLGFCDTDGSDAGAGGQRSVETPRKFFSDVAGDVFGAWVELVEWGEIVQVVVLEGFYDFVELVLDGMEVAEETVVVEGVAADGGGDFPVVSVDVLAGGADGEGVSGAEGGIDGELEH